MYKLAAVVLMCCLPLTVAAEASGSEAEEKAQKERDIREMIEVSGGLAAGEQMANLVTAQMVRVLKQSNAEVPQYVLDAMPTVIGELVAESMPELANRLVPVYAKHFTHQEVQEMLAFFRSEVGRKIVAKNPQIMTESMEVGRQWGASIGPEVQARILAYLAREGVELPEP